MLILLLAAVGAAWLLQHLLYKKNWEKGLSAELEFTDSYVYEGDLSYLKQTVTNAKYLPLPALEVRFFADRNLNMQGEARENTSVSDNSYQREVFSLWGRQQVIRKIPFLCEKRGIYEIKRSELVGYDLTYSSSYYTECAQNTRLYVYPGRVDVRKIRLVCQAISGAVLAKQRLYPDPFEFSGIREYERTDPMNLINWKASAKTGGLMVNQLDSTTNVQLTVILDVEDKNILKYEELVEESIRITASLSALLIQQGMEFRLVSNGMESMYLKAGAGMLQELNQRLAAVDVQQVSEDICQTIEKNQLLQERERIFVLITKNDEAAVYEMAERLAKAGNQILWVLPEHPYMKKKTESKPGIQMLKWEVG